MFTDIEGSTRRWDRDRAAMQEAVRLHDRIMRAAVAAHAGYVFRTVGDAFCAAFATPESAVAAALYAQRALGLADFSAVNGLRVRMAIATGTADELDGDYFGPTVNRVARLLSLGYGGQVLLSDIAAGLVRENPPPQTALADLGAHALKDIDGPEHVFQLVAPDLQRDFPALRAEGASRLWLVPDAMRTRYFTGRDDLLALLRQELELRNRAALSGLGGVGKTQAAIAYAERYRTEYPGGVFWVNAETVGGLTSGFVEIAKALRLPAAESNAQEQAVKAVLERLNAAGGWLLILDNVDARRELLPFVPERGQGDILITSREAVFQELGIPRALEVRDLDIDEAVRFLLARTGREDCELRERAAASDLATELGNLPLALEQAAAYIAETSAAFAGYLSAFRKRRVTLLEKASGLVSRDTVSVTWAANFAAVEKAASESADLLRLSALVAPDAIPFAIFESLTGGDEMAMAEALRPLARYSLVRIDAKERTYGVHRLVQEIVRAALGEPECGTYVGRAVAALNAAFPDSTQYVFWAQCGRLVPHVVSIAHWVNAYQIQPPGVCELLNKAARHLNQRGRYDEAEKLSRQSLTLGRLMLGPDHRDVGASLNNLAIIYQREGRFAESEPLYAEALAIRRNALGPDHPDVANTLLNFGNMRFAQGRYNEARSHYEQAAAALERAVGTDHEWFATAVNNIARVHEKLGRYDEAQPLDERALAIRERVLGPEHPHVALSLHMVANGYAHAGNYEKAQALHERGLEIRERTLGRDHDDVAESLNDLAAVYVKQGRYPEARALYERALAIGERAFGPSHPAVNDSLHGLAFVHLREGRYADAEQLFERSLTQRERTLGSEHADVAESLLGIAALHAERGHHDKAAAHLERALAIKKGTLAPDHPELAEIRSALRSAQQSAAMHAG